MVTYNKQGVAKKGDRILSSGGPRDRQRKLAMQDNIKYLAGITTNMAAKDVGYSKEQLQQIINESLEDISIDLENKYIKELSDLKKDLIKKEETIENLNNNITKLEDKLDKRDSTILELSKNLTTAPRTIVYTDEVSSSKEQARPAIDQVFIDPSVKGSENKYESHIKTKEELSTKSRVKSDVDKLKALMGSKLPKI